MTYETRTIRDESDFEAIVSLYEPVELTDFETLDDEARGLALMAALYDALRAAGVEVPPPDAMPIWITIGRTVERWACFGDLEPGSIYVVEAP